MKKILSVLCIAAIGLLTMGAAPGIRSYRETFRMEADGPGRVVARVELAGLTPGVWEVPLTTWKGIEDLKWTGVPADVRVQAAIAGRAPCLRLDVGQGAVAGFAMELDYRALAPKPLPRSKTQPPGETRLRFRFLNDGRLPVADYGLKVLLPAGKVVHSVQETAPQGKGGNGAQVSYIKEDNRQGFVLAAENLRFGDAAGIQLTVVADEKSPAVVILLGLAAILYLVAFRDIVRPPS